MKKRVLCIILTVILTISLLPVTGFLQESIQREFYISPEGSDTNIGTESAPFATFQKARDEIRLINGNMTGDIVVYAMGGTYRFTEPLELGPEDSGTNGYNIVYRNYQGQSPIISGGQEITGWSLHDAEKGIWEADAEGIETRQLYVNETRAVRARSEGGLQGAVKTATGYTTTDTEIQNWGNISDIEFVYNINWTQSRVGVASISGTTVTMKLPAFAMNQDKSNDYIHPTVPTYIENAYELLDMPGEWYLDRTAGKIYYIPKAGENINTATVVAPVLETLVEGSGTINNPICNIRFEGLTFSYATWLRPSGNEGFAEIQANFCRPVVQGIVDTWVQTPGNLEFTYARNVIFERNIFSHLGAGALHFGMGSQDNVISGNKIFDISSSGVQIGGISAEDRDPTGTEAEKAEKTVRNNRVANNYICDIGAEYKGAVGIWAGYTDGTVIEHNELTALPYTAISVGWGYGAVNTPTQRNNIIRYNYIHDGMNVLFDGGGIYTLGEQPGTVISRNVISDQHNNYGSIYLDDGSRYMTVQDNIMYDNVKNFYAKGSDHVITGNYWDRDYDNWYYQSNSILENNTVAEDGNFPIHIINQAGLEYEYQDLLPQDENRNLACGKPVRIYDGTESAIMKTQEGHPGSNVTDNDRTTFMSTGLVDPCIVEIDLKRIQHVGSIVLNLGVSYTGGCTIKATVDGLDWEDVDTVDIRDGRNIILLDGRQARNIRLCLPSGLIMLDEIEVYAVNESIPFALGEEAFFYTAGHEDAVYEVVSGSNVSVDENGIVEALAVGDALITAAYTGGSLDTGLSVNEFVEKTVVMNRDFVVIGKDAQLCLTGETEGGMKMPVSMGTITYGVDDMSRAAVDPQTGVITGMQAGQVVVAATHDLYGLSEVVYRSFDVAGEKLDSVGLSSDSEVYYVSDGTIRLDLKVMLNTNEYAEPDQYDVLYTSDDTSVAEVDNTGLVTIHKVGVTNISAAVTFGGVTKTAGIRLSVFPEGWKYKNTGQTGSAEYSGNQWIIRNAGDDIYGVSDQFTYVYKEINMQDYPKGVSIIATVTSVQEDVHPHTMTGLMIRESISRNSKNVNYRIHSTGVGVEDKFVPLTYRLENGGVTQHITTQSLQLPARIKLTRVDDDIYAHYLDKSNQWIRAGVIENIGMSESFTVGIAHCSHNSSVETAANVEDIVVEEADSYLIADPLAINAASTILKKGDTLPLSVSGTVEGETLQFTSDNEDVATVGQDGIVSGIAAGKSVITVKALVKGVENPNRSASVTILVYDDINELEIVNMALNKQAYAFAPSMQGFVDINPSFTLPNGVDGTEATITISASTYAWAFAVDLGDLYTVKSMEVVFHSMYYATEYEILGSMDMITWTKLGETTGGSGESKTFVLDSPAAIRYAAVRAVKPDGPGQPGTQMSIAEFRVNAYEILCYTVTFESNGGSGVPSQTVERNNKAVEPAVPTKEGYTFGGWYADSGFTTAFDFENTDIVEDITLYAKWEENVVNVALNKQAYGLTPDMQGFIEIHADFPLSNGVDGSEATITISAVNYTWAFAVDLGDLYAVRSMDAVFHSMYYATEYEFLGSTDMVNWRKLGVTITGSGESGSIVFESPEIIRYAAVRSIKPDGPQQPGIQMSVSEFRVNAFVLPRHTVAFEANGGSAVGSQLVEHNGKAVEPSVPAKEGYTFAGWYADYGFTTAFDFAETAIIEDITLYARWYENIFVNAALNKQAYAFMPDMQSLIDTHAGYPPPNGVDGSESTITIAAGSYAWAFAVDLADLYTVKSMDVVFHSMYYATDYEILGSTDMTTWIKLGETTGGSGEPKTFVLDMPTAIRYAAVRAIKPDGPGQPGTQMSVAEFRVNAFVIPRHTVAFEANGGSTVGSQLVEHNGRAVEPPDPAKEGYTFAGWYADSSFTTAFDFANTDIVEDITLYAKWEENTFNAALNKQAYAFMPDMQSLIDTHAGYPPPNGVDGSESTITIATGSYLWAFAVDLADLYMVKSMEVVFHSMYYATEYEILGSTDMITWTKLGETTGGSGEPKTFLLDSPATIRYAAVRALKPDGPGQPGTQMSVAEFRVNAFVMPRHTVAFEANGGSAVGSQLVEHNGRAVEPSVPAKEGYTFAGWYADSSFTTAFDFADTDIVEDITLYAKWEENTFNAALNKQAYAFMPDMQSLIDTHAGYPPPNGVDGSESTITIATGSYLWAFAVDLADLYMVKSMEVVFHSMYYATEYEILGSTDMITWTKLGETTGGSGEPKTFVLDMPTAIRYAAVRALKPDGPGQPGTQMSVAEFRVNAFVIPRHAVTFEVDGGSEVGIQLVEHNGRAVEPSVPAKEGYTFAGWYADSSFTTAFDFADTDIVEDITLYAKWEENTFNAALNKQAYAFMPDMQSVIDTHAGYPPPNGVDGSESTITIATGSYLWAFAVDLADLYMVKSMEVVFHSMYYATEYEILGSTDMITWTKLGETTGGSGEPKTFVLDMPTAIRYAAVRALKPDGPGQPGTQMSVAEFRVNAFAGIYEFVSKHFAENVDLY